MINTKNLYDISMSLCGRTPVWPSSVRFQLRWLKNIMKNGVNESTLSFSTHTGTHIDLPYHFIESGERVKNLSIERLIGKALVAKFTEKSDIGREFLNKIDISKDCNKLLFKTQNSIKLRGYPFRCRNVIVSL